MPAARFVYGRPVEEMGCADARDHRGRQKYCTPYESRSIGFGRFGPHVLRRTMATQLLRDGADPVLVADLFGHADLGTLKIYTQPNDTDRERAVALLTTDA